VRPLIALLVACGTTAPPPRPTPPLAPSHGMAIAPSIDPFSTLVGEPSTDAERTQMVPGPARLDTTGAPLDAPPGAPPIEVAVVDQQGNLVRVAVRLDHARFLVWSDRDRLFAVVTRDQRVSAGSYVPPEFNEPASATLRAGSHVRRLAHKDNWTQVRYFGGVEIDGWVPDDALADRSKLRASGAWAWPGGQRVMLMPGAIIHSEPKWASPALALMANTPFVDKLEADPRLDHDWAHVRYSDVDVLVEGYVSQKLPPGSLHRPQPPDPPPTPITPTDPAPDATCLYAHEDGEPIGFLVGDHPVQLAPSDHLGWWKLAIDTPWGAMTFIARGASKLELLPCTPAASPPAAQP
jgi:hypothetical protein